MKKRILSQCCNVPTAISKSTKKGTRIICSHCGKNAQSMPKIPREINPKEKKFDVYKRKVIWFYISKTFDFNSNESTGEAISGLRESEPRIINLKQPNENNKNMVQNINRNHSR